jgi:hypothetical protein
MDNVAQPKRETKQPPPVKPPSLQQQPEKTSFQGIDAFYQFDDSDVIENHEMEDVV